jgi:Ni/Co efflux regulator RcnB
MTTIFERAPRLAVIAVVAGLLSGGALAEKPEWVSQKQSSKAGKDQHEGHRSASKGGDSAGHRFDDGARRHVHDYYGSQFRAGKCPPGLAKKHNGCMPPGQAKKWAKGQPLPRDLSFHDLPRELRTRLPPPPRDHRYVRVASDILLIAIGTRMVVDAIEDIGR